MSKHRTLVVAPQPFFRPRGTPFSVYYRTMVMAQLGMSIDLLTYGEGEDVDIPNVTIHRIPRLPLLSPIPIGPSRVKLLLDLVLVVWTFGMLIKNRYRIVHAHEEAVFFCALLKPFFGYKLVYDMHSSLPQQLTNFQFTTSKLLIGLFKFLEDQSLKIADAIITICPDLEDYVLGMIADPTKHVMIENSIFDPVKFRDDTQACNDHHSSEPSNKIIHNFSAEEKLVVYAGSLEPYQGIDILLEAFKRVLPQEPDAKLLIMGGLPQQVHQYLLLARKIGITPSVFFTGQVPQHIAQELCRTAAVQVSPRSKGTNTPLKIYEQLASGVPIVATNIYSHTQTIDSRVAFLVDPEPQSMARGIVDALQFDGRRESIAQAACTLYEKKYSRAAYEKKLKKLFDILNPCAE